MTDTPKRKTALARQMRKALTGPEWLLWERLKSRLDDRLIFKRQHAFGPYVLDFYCFKARPVIEVDGATHGEDAAILKDALRDAYLRDQGLEVYRLPATEFTATRKPLQTASACWRWNAPSNTDNFLSLPIFDGEGDRAILHGGVVGYLT